MDLVLHLADDYLLDNAWARLLPLNDNLVHSSANFTSIMHHVQQSAWPRDYIPRQIISLIVINLVGVHFLYFLFAWLSYKFIFNHEMMRHPRFLENQVKLEIQSSLQAFPVMTILTLPWFQAEVMGYSQLYDNVEDYGWTYFVLSIPFFLIFTDYGIYWIHRLLHHPSVYKTLHKTHHKWIVPTPFASHAFHPVDGYLQSVPYHLFVFLFPLHRWLYLGLFVFVNFWTIIIHDSDMITGHALETMINGPAHHTLHHLYFTVNYGQYFTWADRVSGSYRQPESSLDPMLDIKKKS
ncbi:C5-sterol desaturase [Suillus bovinus]|uniref:C5-sterol desaturase n=1 Tax=Suillus bovinus TaxID=48563 RepID=UPI001B87F688|nr:C5-sterol desaturase [Suillus bovinus]KAG2157889.1 C5-sterol desaturase [Suillus bovinus]